MNRLPFCRRSQESPEICLARGVRIIDKLDAIHVEHERLEGTIGSIMQQHVLHVEIVVLRLDAAQR
jgi:hypothetical protein